MKTRSQGGFTLIELLITVTIVGILSAIALPTYADYTNRARISEGLLAASACETTITEAYQSGTPATDMSSLCTSSNPSKYVTSTSSSADGAITVSMNSTNIPALGTHTDITMVPTTSAGVALTNAAAGTTTPGAWKCGPATSGGVVTATAIDPKYLPSSCKG